MRRVIPSIVKQIANFSVAASLGAMTLIGGAARAETVQQRAEAELNNGKDYAAAWQAATRAGGAVYAPELSAKADRAVAALNAGKDYVAAWDAARPTDSVTSEEQIAEAKRVDDALSAGQDYTAAWKARAKAQPARVETPQPVVETASGHELTRTVK